MCVLPGSKQDLKIESSDGVERNWNQGLVVRREGWGCCSQVGGGGGLRQAGGPGLRRTGQVGSAGSSELLSFGPALLLASAFNHQLLLSAAPSSSVQLPWKHPSPCSPSSLQLPPFHVPSLPGPLSLPSYCSQLYWMPPPLPAPVPAPPPHLSLSRFLFPIPPFPHCQLSIGTRVYFNCLSSCLNKV